MDAAKAGFESGVASAISGLNSTLDGIKSALESNVSGAQASRDANLDAIDTALDALDSAMDSAIEGLETTLNGDLDSANATHTAAIDAARSAFEGTQSTINSQLEGDITSENGTFDTAVAGFQATLDTAVTGAQATFDTAAGLANSAFDGFVASQQAAADSIEQGLWNTYVSGSGTGPTGVLTTFNSSMAANDATLAGVLALYPGVTYDPSSVIESQSHTDFLAAQEQSLMTTVMMLTFNLQNNIQAELDGIESDINAPGGPGAQYNGAVNLSDGAFDTTVDTARDDFEDDVDGYYQTYSAAVDGLRTTLDGALDSEEDTFDGALDTAKSGYDSAMTGPKAAYDSAVDTAIDGFSNWLDNIGGSTLQTAISGRKAALQTQIDGFVLMYDSVMDAAELQLEGDIKAADVQYWEDVYGPGGEADIFRTFRNTQYGTNLYGSYNSEYSTYQSAEAAHQAVMTTYYMQMMTAMMNGLPIPAPPSSAALDQAAKDYFINVGEAEAGVSDSVGNAYLGFWGAERGYDNTRDTAVINALYTYGVSAQNAQNGLQSQILAAYGLAQHDIIDYTQNFADGAMTAYLGMMGSINSASNALDLAHNTAFEAYQQSANSALTTYKQNVAGHVRDFRKQEADKFLTYQQSANARFTTLQGDVALAAQTRANSIAAAGKVFDQQLNGIINTREKNISALETSFTQAVTNAVIGTTTTIANQVAAQVAAAAGGGADVTAVANAHAAHTTGAMGAWKNAIDGDAAVFQGYLDQYSDQRKTLDDQIADQEELRLNALSGAMQNSMNAVAGAGQSYADNRAGAAKDLTKNIADKVKNAQDNFFSGEYTFGNSAISAGKTKADSIANAYLTNLNGVLGQIGSNASGASPLTRQAQHDRLNEALGFETSKLGSENTAALAELQQKKTTALGLVTAEDGIVASALGLKMARRSAYAWQFVVDADNRPLSYYANSRPTGPVPLSGTITWLDVPSPENPATPPAPPPPPATPQPKPPVEFENPYWEGVKGFFGGLKTGAKAVVNSSVDTVASTVTLGQYDPPDVWQVDPNTDLYYAQSRFFADIATNAASAAATGGLSGSAGRLGQVARIADKMDTVGNVINGVKGAVDASENGLNWQNGAQIAVGMIGAAQVGSQLSKSETFQRLMVDEVGAFGHRDTISALRIQQAHPDLPVRLSDSAPTHGIFNDTKPLVSGAAGGDAAEVFADRVSELSKSARTALTHVEGHAAAEMLKSGLKEAVLHINYKVGPCPICRSGVPELLDNDMKL